MGKIIDEKYWGDEIPQDVPVCEYVEYLTKNIDLHYRTKPDSEWSEFNHKEYKSYFLRRVAARKIVNAGWNENTATERQKRIIEMVRNGTDFDVSVSEFNMLFNIVY